MYSDFLIEHGTEPDPEDDHDFADIQTLFGDTIGSTMAHRAELQRAMRPWEPARPTEPAARIEDLSVRRKKERERKQSEDSK
jgi:hypothetical protein